MRTYTRGDGEPEIAVLGAVHGDEVCGKKAIERILAEDIQFQKPVKFIIVNEKAAEMGARYLEKDLNRIFSDDPNGETHEEQLAVELANEINGLTVLDLHSTHSYDQPFAVITSVDATAAELVPMTGVDRAANLGESGGSNVIDYTDGVVVECGLTGTQQTTDNAYRVTRNFLAAQGALNESFETSDPDVYEVLDEIPKKHAYEVNVENFTEVEEGTVFAESDHGQLRAQDAFVPVLMSENGYKDVLGFRAKHRGRLSELVSRIESS